ncbi:MAG: LacI family DNA-binding transcriptional regulator [Flavobacterium sp.]
MKDKQITLKNIAEELNISVTTVSKALKNYADVSPKTKAAVLNLAQKLNYTPNEFAVNLRTQASKTIGLIIPEVVHHFFSNVINGIIDEAEKNNYLVIILQSNESKEMEKKQVRLLLNKRVDGIIMSLSNESNDEAHILEIIERDIPLVIFDKISKAIPCSKVIIDDRLAAQTAVQHLIEMGCQNIAHIRGPLNPQNAIDRFLGYKQALEKHDLVYQSKMVRACTRVSFEEGFAFAKEIMTQNPETDGFFVITDLVAVGVLSYLNQAGIKVPEQVKVIGFSNWFMSKVISPSLSTIDQPSYEMGTASFEVLLEAIQKKNQNEVFVPRIKTLPTQLIVRQSTSNNIQN